MHGHDLSGAALHNEWPLTDGCGLREMIRQQTAFKKPGGQTQECFPLRSHCFVSLDEEQDYAFFNAYTAYRFGYRAMAPLCWEEAERQLNTAGKVQAVFEDVFLQYPDQPENLVPPMSYLKARDQKLPALKTVTARLLVTSGGRDRLSSRGGARETENLHHVQELRAAGCHVKLVGKPLAGMFRLWSAASMSHWLQGERLAWQIQHGSCFVTPGCYGAERAPGFERAPDETDDEPGNHSAPGRLLMVARQLLQRGEALLAAGVESVEEAVRGAVLATDAYELLGNRTPTTALEALAVKHQFEVLAECQFIGVQHNIEVKQRVKELRHEIKLTCRRFARSERRAAALDAEVAILGKLVSIFQDHNQFDEEMQCLYRQRQAMAKLTQARHGPLGWGLGWMWRYLNWLVLSPLRFLIGIAGWLALGCLLFSLATQLPWDWTPGALDHSMNAFFAGNGPDGDFGWAESPLSTWTVRLLTVLGLFHFGVFISYIYTLISRK
jgi:hypothetical protein